jgi:hypothetical protein
MFAALAAVALWSPEGPPDCEEYRPIYGPIVCCERHRAADTPASAVEAELRVRALAPPGRRARVAAE